MTPPHKPPIKFTCFYEAFMRLLEAHRMKLLLTPTLLRATLVWVLLGALTLVFPLLAKAQTNDQGAVVINGQISNQTCVFVMSESNNISNDTNSSLNLKLGNVPLATAQAAAEGDTFGLAKTVYFFTKTSATNSTACQGGPVFDIGLTVPFNKVLHTGTQTLLLSNGTVDSGAVGGVALSLKSTMGRFVDGNFAGFTPLNLTQGSPFGVLLSGKTNLTESLVGLGNTRVYALTVQFAKASSTASAGAYASTIVVNMWWR